MKQKQKANKNNNDKIIVRRIMTQTMNHRSNENSNDNNDDNNDDDDSIDNDNNDNNDYKLAVIGMVVGHDALTAYDILGSEMKCLFQNWHLSTCANMCG